MDCCIVSYVFLQRITTSHLMSALECAETSLCPSRCCRFGWERPNYFGPYDAGHTFGRPAWLPCVEAEHCAVRKVERIECLP